MSLYKEKLIPVLLTSVILLGQFVAPQIIVAETLAPPPEMSSASQEQSQNFQNNLSELETPIFYNTLPPGTQASTEQIQVDDQPLESQSNIVEPTTNDTQLPLKKDETNPEPYIPLEGLVLNENKLEYKGTISAGTHDEIMTKLTKIYLQVKATDSDDWIDVVPLNPTNDTLLSDKVINNNDLEVEGVHVLSPGNYKVRIRVEYTLTTKDGTITDYYGSREALEKFEIIKNSEEQAVSAKKVPVLAESTATPNTWGEVTWVFDENLEMLTFTSRGTLGESDSSPWNNEDGLKIDPTKIKKIEFKKMVEAPFDASYLFSGLSEVTQIIGLSKLDTGKTTNMMLMFGNMSSLESLDLSNFDTQKVTNMYAMFDGLSEIKILDLSNFDTPNVTYMSRMFSGMSSLENLSIENFNTSRVVYMELMFLRVSSLKTLDLSHFTTPSVSFMYGMFSEMSSLKSLNIENFNISPLNNILDMFLDTQNLSELTLGENFKFTKPVKLYNHSITGKYTGEWINERTGKIFDSSKMLEENYDGPKDYGTYRRVTLKWGDVEWEFDNGVLKFTSGGTFGGYESSPWNQSGNEKIDPKDIKKIEFTEAVEAPIDASYLFSDDSDDNDGYLSGSVAKF